MAMVIPIPTPRTQRTPPTVEPSAHAMDISLQPHSLLRLHQLLSPALPVGAYAYSRGLEQAVEAGLAVDEASASAWICGVCEHNLAALDVPLLARLLSAFTSGDVEAITRWNAVSRSARETHELALEDYQLGQALLRLLGQLELPFEAALRALDPISYITAFACACHGWEIPVVAAAQGLLFGACENQVTAAMKLIPLGQAAGQRILSGALQQIPRWTRQALARSDDQVGTQTFGLSLCSARHETQYARLFRS